MAVGVSGHRVDHCQFEHINYSFWPNRCDEFIDFERYSSQLFYIIQRSIYAKFALHRKFFDVSLPLHVFGENLTIHHFSRGKYIHMCELNMNMMQLSSFWTLEFFICFPFFFLIICIFHLIILFEWNMIIIDDKVLPLSI